MVISTRFDVAPERKAERIPLQRPAARRAPARALALLAAAGVTIGCAGPGTPREVTAATDWPVIERSAVTLPVGQESGLELAQVANTPSSTSASVEFQVDPGTTQITFTSEMLQALADAKAMQNMLRLDDLFRSGDRILFGLELDDEGDVERWTMELRIAEVLSNPGAKGSTVYTGTLSLNEDRIEVRSHLYDGHISLWNQSGGLVGETTVAVPHSIGDGLTPICLILDELGPETWTDELFEGLELASDRRFMTAMAQSLTSVMSVLTIVDENELLAPILMQAARTPSLVSLIGNLGVKLTIRLDLERQVRLERPGPKTPWGGLPEQPFFSVPATITANGEEALLIDFFVTTPAAPLAPCGGVLALVGRHPSRDVTFRMNVIGASRLEPDAEREHRGSQ